MMRWVEFPTVFAVQFVRASAWNTLWNRLVAATVVVILRSISCIFLSIFMLEYLMSNLLTVVVLYRLWSVLKGADYAGFSPSVQEPVSQEPLCITTFGQVNNY